MEIKTLRSFLAVAREGNVTHAARTLHITQPALSRQLSDLERELGCELLIRESRGVTLTDEGTLLRKRAEEIVSLADRTELEIRSPAAEVEGDVWVGGGESRAMDIVARTTARITSTHPGVRVRLHSGNADDVLERVDKGLLDFGIVLGRKVGNRYETLELPWQDRWGILVRRDHPLADRASVTIDELREYRLIVSAQAQAVEGVAVPTVLPNFWEEGFNIVATYTLLYNASLLVEQSVGVAVTIDGIVAAGEGTPFSFVPLEEVPLLPSKMVWKRFVPLSRASELFLSYLREDLG